MTVNAADSRNVRQADGSLIQGPGPLMIRPLDSRRHELRLAVSASKVAVTEITRRDDRLRRQP